MQPDFIAGLVGQPDKVQRQVLDGIKAGLPGGDKVYGLGYGIGGGLGKSIGAGIASKPVTVAVKPIDVQPLWSHLQSFFSSNPIKVKTTSVGIGGGLSGHALGGVFTRPTYGLFGEDGPEAIVPLSKPARAREVMQEAGIGGNTIHIGNITIADHNITDWSTFLAAAQTAVRMGAVA